jgi:hypothetical protein
MAQRAATLRKLLAPTKRLSEQTNAAFLRAEDTLSNLEQREAGRARRQNANEELRQRFPALRRNR